jgi:hypothetical protein
LEVINDASGDLVALYRRAQFHLEALIGEVEFRLAGRTCRPGRTAGLTKLQRAALFM